MRRLAGILAGAPLLLAVALLGGCGKTKGVLQPNVPPQTFLFVQGAIDTVNHRVHLYWYGSDPDGDVVAFDLRTFNDSLPADTNWKRLQVASGAAYDSFFTVYTPSGFTDLRFEVRAVDNDGVVDPSPAVQDFALSNQAPVVDLASYPGLTDTTYASLTFSWTATDPDGDGNQMRFHIWLDGQTGYDSTTARTFTLPSARFLRAGTFTSGYRTLYVQAIDDGGRFGPIDSTRWFVRAPGTVLVGNKARILLVDDIPGSFGNNFTIDTLYANTLTRNLTAGSFSILRLSTTQPFRSGADLAQTFRQFDAVVWYRGDQSLYPFGPLPGIALLESYQDSIAAYIDGGGRFYLESMSPVQFGSGSTDPNSRGPFRDSFMRTYLGADSMRTYFNVLLQEAVAAWGNTSSGKYRSSTFADSLQATSILQTVGIRGFAVRDTANVALWALPGALTPPNPEQMAVAVVVRQPSGGKALFTTYPVRFSRPAAPPHRMLAKLLFDATRGLMAP